MTSAEPLQDWRSRAASLVAQGDCPSLSVKWGTHWGSLCASSIFLHGKQSSGSHSYILHFAAKGIKNVWIMQNYKSMKMVLRVPIPTVNNPVFSMYSHGTLFSTYLLIPAFQAYSEKSSSRIVLNHPAKSGVHTGPISWRLTHMPNLVQCWAPSVKSQSYLQCPKLNKHILPQIYLYKSCVSG